MPIFIDRRLNPSDKSLGNRQRFLRRAREELKRSLRDQIGRGSISDVDAAHSVPIPGRGIDEPRFVDAPETGRRKYVLPGNKEFAPGDRIPKPAGGGGVAGGGAGRDATEDDFRFVLSREEVLDLFFEDLALPDMVKLSLKEIAAWKPRRAGFSVSGSSTNVNVVRTMRNSYGRRIALKRPTREEIGRLESELAELEGSGTGVVPYGRIAELRAEIERLKKRRRVIAYVDPIDLRFNRFDPQPVPNANAVMFCLMDVSGSMGEREKDLAKRFFVLLHLFLKRRYERTDIVFIRHTHEAQEVDENTFFYSTESGGTVVSTALEEMRAVIERRYPVNRWNIYAAQASDGDNLFGDSERCTALLHKAIMPVCQYFAYVEIIDERESHIFRTTANGTSLWHAYKLAGEKWPNLQMSRIASPADIYPVFRALFTRRTSAPGREERRR